MLTLYIQYSINPYTQEGNNIISFITYYAYMEYKIIWLDEETKA